MQPDTGELKLVRQYAINEIAGGLMLGKRALLAEDPDVRSKLTYHSMDELRHGWLWTKYLNDKGVGPARAKGGNDYFDLAGSLADETAFLAAVHVYELRVPFHLGSHMEFSQVNPDLREVIRGICDDEKHHLSWIREVLLRRMQTDREAVLRAIAGAEKAEKETYERYAAHLKRYDGYLGAFGAFIESRMPRFVSPTSLFH